MASAKKSLSSLEEMIWKFAADYVGQEVVDTLRDEAYLPFWKYGSVALVGMMLIFGAFGQLISNMVGFIYPAYYSIRALESSSKSDDTRWLTYWVVFASFSLLDTFSGFILGWLPFYWLAKVLFLAWCFAPGDFNGSQIIYHHIILPFFVKHETQISHAMRKVDNIVGGIAQEAEKVASTVQPVVAAATEPAPAPAFKLPVAPIPVQTAVAAAPVPAPVPVEPVVTEDSQSDAVIVENFTTNL